MDHTIPEDLLRTENEAETFAQFCPGVDVIGAGNYKDLDFLFTLYPVLANVRFRVVPVGDGMAAAAVHNNDYAHAKSFVEDMKKAKSDTTYKAAMDKYKKNIPFAIVGVLFVTLVTAAGWYFTMMAINYVFDTSFSLLKAPQIVASIACIITAFKFFVIDLPRKTK